MGTLSRFWIFSVHKQNIIKDLEAYICVYVFTYTYIHMYVMYVCSESFFVCAFPYF